LTTPTLPSFRRALNLLTIAAEILFAKLFFIRPKPRLSDNDRATVRRIAVFTYMGLGDAIMMLPMLRALKAAFPQALLHSIGSERTAARHVFRMAGIFDETHFYEFKDASLLERWRMNRRLARQNFDLALCTYTAPIEHFVPLLLAIPHRAGHLLAQDANRSTAANRFRPDHLFQYRASIGASLEAQDRMHETERYARLLQVILPESVVERSPKAFQFYNDGNDNSFNTASLQSLRVGIHAAASTHLAWKNWGTARFVELCSRLIQQRGAEILLFGDASERGEMQAMVEAIENALGIQNSGETTPVHLFTPRSYDALDETCAALLTCTVLVGNESGIGHVAMSLGVPTVRIFGMTDFDSFRALDPALHTDIRHPLPCSPCFRLGKVQPGMNMTNCGHHNCLNTITVDEVVHVVLHTLER
jgi:ADP-heptose:LPS heptosyltransferase